jgi:hypothetical protein
MEEGLASRILLFFILLIFTIAAFLLAKGPIQRYLPRRQIGILLLLLLQAVRCGRAVRVCAPTTVGAAMLQAQLQKGSGSNDGC